MLVTNQTHTSQTVETKTNESIQKVQSDTNFSNLLNEKIKSSELVVNTSFCESSPEMITLTEAEMNQAIPIEVYLQQKRQDRLINMQNLSMTHQMYQGSFDLSLLQNKSLFTTDQYDAIIATECEKFGIDPLLIKSIIKHESGFNTNVVSSAGASGLMQLMPSNIRHYGVADPFNPEENIAAGVKHFKSYYDMYKGDLELTLAAYNAGPGNVKKYGGVPPFKETQNYIERVLGTYEKAKSI